MRFPSYIGAVIPALATIVVLTGCHGGSDDSPVVRGTVTPPALSVLDGDTNNPGDRLAPNDTVDDAQNLPNPATVVGYVTAQADSGAVSGARFAERADPDDYYRIALAQGHGVNLVIADSTAADLDLFLLNPDGSPAASSMGSTATESVSAPADGDYIVQVHANTVTGSSGSSNYFLSLGQGVQALQQQVMRMEDDFVPGEVIVRYRNAAAPSGTLSTLSGAPGRAMLLGLGQGTQRRASLQALDLTGPAVDAGRHHPLSASQQARADTILATKALRRRANVAWAGLNHRVYPAAIPNDPRYDQQWNLPILNMADAWDEIQPGDGDVVVAVVDTGIVPTHPDLNDNLDLVDGYDFIANTLYSGDGDGLDDDPSVPGLDGDFHGTHVSGIVAAETDNGVGVAGVAGPSGKVRIMPLRALGQAGGTEYDVLQAVRYALGLDNDSGKLPAETAQIVNMSLGGTTGSLADAFAAIQTASDAVLVAAAGNSGANSLLFPAGYRGVVAVGATTDTDAIADYSNYGEALDVVAPGGTSTNPIVSTWGDTDGNPGTTADMYASEAGTSMATPHVSGVAALMKSVWPKMTAETFRCALAHEDITVDLGTPGRDETFGWGRIDGLAAVQAARRYAGDPSLLGGIVTTSPTSVDLGSVYSDATLSVDIACDGATDVTGISSSAPWVSITPEPSALDRGLGDYTVTVDRSAIPDGGDPIASATITIQAASLPSLTVPVRVVREGTVGFSADAGTQFVLLVDEDTGENAAVQPVEASDGDYGFRFTNVPDGRYGIVAGSDNDWDGLICDAGETCGGYPTFANPQVIEIAGQDETGLDFPLNLVGGSNTQARSRSVSAGAGLNRE